MIATLRRYWWPLAIVAVLSLSAIVRVWLMVRAEWIIEGDEATMGLVGMDILREHVRPIYFPGQAYMGTWQSYLAALSFLIFDISRPAAKLVPLMSSVAWVGTTILLARRIYNREVAILAGVFAAVPSLYFLSTTLRIAYPLIDVMAIGNVILYLAIDTVWRDSPPRRIIWRFLLMGLLAGFGFWMHSAIAMYVAPAALVLLLRWPRASLVSGAPFSLGGFLIGSAPVFNHAFQYDYSLFHYLRGNPSDTAARGFPAGYLKIGNHLVEHLLPRYLGTSVSWQGAAPLLQLLVGAPTVLAIAYVAWTCRHAPLEWVRRRPHRGNPESVLLLFGAIVLVTYVLSRFSVYAILFPNIDTTGRYVAPIGTLIPIMLAGAAWRVSRTGDLGKIVAVALSIAIVGGTFANYARSDPYQVFQSPYYRHLPPSSDELIATLDDMGVNAVWIDHWAGKPLMFDSGARVAAADYVDLRIYGGIDRFREQTDRVFEDESPAFVFVTDATRVPLEDTLEDRNIAFETASVAGYRIVHPLERIDPATVAADLEAVR